MYMRSCALWTVYIPCIENTHPSSFRPVIEMICSSPGKVWGAGLLWVVSVCLMLMTQHLCVWLMGCWQRISGLFPVWSMSRLQPADLLQAERLCKKQKSYWSRSKTVNTCWQLCMPIRFLLLWSVLRDFSILVLINRNIKLSECTTIPTWMKMNRTEKTIREIDRSKTKYAK